MHADLVLVGADELAQQAGLLRYFEGFSVADLLARKTADDGSGGEMMSAHDCMRRYLASVVPPDSVPPDVVRLLRADVAKAHRLCMMRAPLLAPVFCPLRVAVMEPHVEGGWPHTHGGVVCLPGGLVSTPGHAEPTQRARTLVHEAVHVLQRRPGEAGAEWMRDIIEHSWGYRPLGGEAWRMLSPNVRARLRSNPDLDGQLYMAPDGSVATQMFPKHRPPQGLADSRIVVIMQSMMQSTEGGGGSGVTSLRHWPHEHPWERMAYMVAETVVPRQ